MGLYLLDTNVLLALVWEQHIHHVPAHAWWSSTGAQDQWASCPMTECGFIRLSSNPRMGPHHATPQEAVRLLTAFTADPRHRFWPDSVSVLDEKFPAQILRGHQQVTDAYLVALCQQHGAILVTFDQAIAVFATALKAPQCVLALNAK